MKGLGPILALGALAGGYYLYKHSDFGVDAIAPSPDPAAGGIQPLPGVAATGSASAAIQAAIKTAATVGGVLPMLNIDQWCWYYKNARGVACPNPLDSIPEDQRAKLLSFDEFWGWATARGLSGFGLAGYYSR